MANDDFSPPALSVMIGTTGKSTGLSLVNFSWFRMRSMAPQILDLRMRILCSSFDRQTPPVNDRTIILVKHAIIHKRNSDKAEYDIQKNQFGCCFRITLILGGEYGA